MWIPAALAVTLLAAMTGIDLYNQMRDQMVEIAEQASTVAVGQLAAILTAAQELLRSTADELKEVGDVLDLAARPETLAAALGEIESITHGTGFGGLSAVGRSGRVIATASDDALMDHDFSGRDGRGAVGTVSSRAPWSSSSSTTSSRSKARANESAVRPSGVRAFTFAPASIR